MEEGKVVAAKSKDQWKVIGIILIIIVVALATVAAIFVCKSIKLKSEVEDLNTRIEKLEGGGETGSNDDVEYLSYTTPRSNLTFDYPKGWSVDSNVEEFEHVGEDYYNEKTTITTTEGYEIQLQYSNAGGVGGTCDPDDMEPTIVAHKEADGMTAGLSVVSFRYIQSGVGFFLSTFTGPYDEPLVGACEVYELTGSNVLDLSGNGDDWGITFFGNATEVEFPSESEYADVVKMLASLRVE